MRFSESGGFAIKDVFQVGGDDLSNKKRQGWRSIIKFRLFIPYYWVAQQKWMSCKKKSGWGLIGCILPKWPYILNLFQVNDLSIGSCWIISLRVVRGFARMEAIAISCNAREFTLVRQPKGIRRCESGALGSVVFSSKSHFTMESNYLEIGLSCGWWACHGVIGLGLWFNRLLAQIATSISWMKSCQIRTLICDTKFWKNRRLADTHTHTFLFFFGVREDFNEE